jgi:hypothetical protein
MKLRKIGAAFIASAVMMTSAAVVAYADEAVATTEAAATDAAAALTASGLTQDQITSVIETAYSVVSGEEIAAFLKGLDSVGDDLLSDSVDSIGEEDLGTILALVTPEDALAFTAWVAEAKLNTLSDDEISALVDEALGEMSDDEINAISESLEGLEDLSEEDLNALIDASNMTYEEWLANGGAEQIANLTADEVKDFCKQVINLFRQEDIAEFLVALGVVDAETISAVSALDSEDIELLIDNLSDDDIESFKATLAASLTGAPATGNVDAATDSSKGSPDTGIADVAAVAGLAALALGGVMVAKKRK